MAACAGVPLSEFPTWVERVVAAHLRGDEVRTVDALTELECGHDAYHALMLLPQRAARLIIDESERQHPGKTTILARPVFPEGTPIYVQIAIQLVAAALNRDSDNLRALAMTVARPMAEATSRDEAARTYSHLTDVVWEVLAVIEQASRGEVSIQVRDATGSAPI